MRGNRYITVEDNFDGAVPPNTGGTLSPSDIAKQKLEEQKIKREELRETEKARAIEFVKERARLAAERNKPEGNSAPENRNNISSKPDANEIHAEEAERKKLVWNPNSKYAGVGRIIQHVKPLKKVSDKILNMGNRYDDQVEYEEDTYGFMNDMPSMVESSKELIRDKLIASGYSKELDIVDKTESNERAKDKSYYTSLEIIRKFMSGQRTKRVNLKGKRDVLLKKLSNQKEDKLYSSLNLLYIHCVPEQI